MRRMTLVDTPTQIRIWVSSITLSCRHFSWGPCKLSIPPNITASLSVLSLSLSLSFVAFVLAFSPVPCKTKHTCSPSFTKRNRFQEEITSQQVSPGKNARLRRPCNEIKGKMLLCIQLRPVRSPRKEPKQTWALFWEGKG